MGVRGLALSVMLAPAVLAGAAGPAAAAARPERGHPEKYGEAFQLDAGRESQRYDVRLLASSRPGIVFLRGEPVVFTFQAENLTDEPIETEATAEIKTYESRTDPLQFFKTSVKPLPDPAPPGRPSRSTFPRRGGRTSGSRWTCPIVTGRMR